MSPPGGRPGSYMQGDGPQYVMKQQGLLASMLKHSASAMHIVPPLLALLVADEELDELAEVLLDDDEEEEEELLDDEEVPDEEVLDDEEVPDDDEEEPLADPPVPDDVVELGGSNMSSSLPSAQLVELPTTQASATPKRMTATFELFSAAIG
jgi:hypothetical protein